MRVCGAKYWPARAWLNTSGPWPAIRSSTTWPAPACGIWPLENESPGTPSTPPFFGPPSAPGLRDLDARERIAGDDIDRPVLERCQRRRPDARGDDRDVLVRVHPDRLDQVARREVERAAEGGDADLLALPCAHGGLPVT